MILIWYPAYELMPYAFDEGIAQEYEPAEAGTEFPGAICNDLFPLGDVRFIIMPTFASLGSPITVHVMFFVTPTFQLTPLSGAVTVIDWPAFVSRSVKELLPPETPPVPAIYTLILIWYPAYELMPYAFEEGIVQEYEPAEANTELP
jgi:hypothetical protein